MLTDSTNLSRPLDILKPTHSLKVKRLVVSRKETFHPQPVTFSTSIVTHCLVNASNLSIHLALQEDLTKIR